MALYIWPGKIFYCDSKFFVGFCMLPMECKNHIPAVKQIVGWTASPGVRLLSIDE